MTPADLAALRAAAEDATNAEHPEVVYVRFVKLANPAAILAILDRLAKLERLAAVVGGLEHTEACGRSTDCDRDNEDVCPACTCCVGEANALVSPGGGA